jgi:UDPglucose 6-dehydrogenase
MDITEAARHSNHEQFEHIISEIERLTQRPLHQATIAIWGLAFKAGTDDTRSSPAIEIARRLQTSLATVCAHDPVVNHVDNLDCGSALEICDNADLLIIATEWPQYAAADYQAVAHRM